MAIRVVLMGLVAGLGLALPPGTQFDSWKRSTRSWVNDRFAAWDSRMPVGEDAFVYVSEPVSPSPKTAAALVVSEPVAAPEVFVAKVDATTTTVSLPITVNHDLVFAAVLDETVAAFSLDFGREPITLAEAGDFEPADEVIADYDRSTEGLCLLDQPSPRPTARIQPVAEATEPGDEFDPVLVFGLDGETEAIFASGVAPFAVATPEPSPSLTVAAAPGGDQLSRAVRLTREAVFAWASLLHGPAVVTASH